jgi:hypothetical protein
MDSGIREVSTPRGRSDIDFNDFFFDAGGFWIPGGFPKNWRRR